LVFVGGEQSPPILVESGGLANAVFGRHKAFNAQENHMPTDPMTLLGLGVGAVVVVWLVFSVVKKMVGIALVLALVAVGWFLWTNPQHLAPIIAYIRQFTG
jgi:hypothetical protein